MTEDTQPKQKDIYQVLAKKERELLTLGQQVNCLRIVLPLLAEENDRPKGWV